MKKNIVSVKNLKNVCDYNKFDFTTTKNLGNNVKPIGQERAVEAIHTALNIEKRGFNLFLCGESGCGKSSIIKSILEKKSKEKNAPNDWIYVHNFENKSKPISIELPNGKAKELRNKLNKAIDNFITQIPKTYHSKIFKNERKNIITEYKIKESELEESVARKCRALNFIFSKEEEGYSITPYVEKDGEISLLDKDDILTLDLEEKKTIDKNRVKISKLIDSLYVKILNYEKKTRKKLEKHIKKVITKSLVLCGFSDIVKNNNISNIKEFLKSVKESIDENYLVLTSLLINDEFLEHYKKDIEIDELTNMYKINLFVDNKKLDGAPVIIDNNPTISSIFGMIEYIDDPNKGFVSGLRNIKPGKIHYANGGYLILEGIDLYKNPKLWEMLKKVIRNQEIIIGDELYTSSSRISVKIEPEPIPVNLKLILLGTPELHEYFIDYDDGFERLFKIKADFNSEIPRTEENEKKYASFIGAKCNEDSLLHLNKKAVCKVIEYSSKLAEDQLMLSTNYSKIVDILDEADYIARSKNKKIVTDEEITSTIEKIEYRLKKENEIFSKLIKDDIIYIDSHGSKVGEINALTVLNSGEYCFGLPVKITAKTFVGDIGVMNIEREIRLSGKIHDKGVLTLSGYIGNVFGQDKLISFDSSISFEQQYYHIDGDSASSTELYALLSSLSEVPIKQNIAVTGSVNQNGQIQAIGGVNEKIEGFYDICKHRGLNNNGVIIPRSNVRNLMLRDELIEDVKKGNFYIYAIDTIEEGIEILTDMKAGDINTPDTIFYKVNEKFKKFYDIQNKE